MTSAFFYGTLMAPTILSWVIDNDGSHLQVAPAVLLEHTRHQVKNVDYPAVVAYEQSRSLFDRELTQDERSVRGTLVNGLTPQDVTSLDLFEGDEYKSEKVQVHILAPPSPMSLASTTHLLSHSTPMPDPLPEPVPCFVYIWIYPLSRLEPILWSYDEFVKEKIHRWLHSEPVGDGDEDGGQEPTPSINSRID
ncbi:uncharacterized protein EI90DRAFT_2966890 [Cantharellus anzutake]|uniref:uncharacterized protein n=1 Tax=Cantharellus anzutake TaxID=1750568 RepID=UPI001905BC92|nr:uncharacterized protein EI90DRAFT_2966890 [Cantharellus anzutake]KAF8339718.1 hypothetical protein EI90DRAFT_2966890 [Cantharellus anzutake]